VLREERASILFVLPSLGGGGAERATLDVMRNLDREKFSPSLAVFSDQGVFRSQVPADVPVYDLRGKGPHDPRLVFRLARLLRDSPPLVVFSVLRFANLVTILAHGLAHSSAVLVVNEQNMPSAEFATHGKAWLKEHALRRLYPRADLVVAISEGIAAELRNAYGLMGGRVHVIPNPVDLERVRQLAAEAVEHPWFGKDDPVILSVGRLHPQKGFVHLIRAFALVRDSMRCRLVILGEGPLRSDLEQLVKDLGLVADVSMPGFELNPYKYMQEADLFVLASLYEGFGIVLVEALALGKPVVATRCPSGPDEIIPNENVGILVSPGDEAEMARAILRVLHDPNLARKLSENGRRRADEYSVDRIARQHEALLTSALRSSPRPS